MSPGLPQLQPEERESSFPSTASRLTLPPATRSFYPPSTPGWGEHRQGQDSQLLLCTWDWSVCVCVGGYCVPASPAPKPYVLCSPCFELEKPPRGLSVDGGSLQVPLAWVSQLPRQAERNDSGKCARG